MILRLLFFFLSSSFSFHAIAQRSFNGVLLSREDSTAISFARIYAKDYTIKGNFEWYADSVSRYIDESLIGKFYREPSLTYPPYVYDSTEWKNLPAFHFQPKEAVYKDLEKQAPVEDQFRKNSKGRDY